MTPPLHIAQVCLPSWGGSSVVAADLALALARAGHRSTVVSAELPPRLADNSAGVRWLAAQVGPHPALERAGAHTVAMAGALVQLCQQESVDVIHCHYAVPHAAAAWLARLTLGAAAPRLVVSLHGTDASAVAADPLYRPLLREALLHADAVTAPSQALAQLAQNALQLPLPPQVVANFVDEKRFFPAPQRDRRRLDPLFGPQRSHGDEPVLLHLSNFRPVKRTLALVPLLAALQQVKPCRLLLVGDGPDRPAVEQALQQAGLSDRCAVVAPRANCLELLQNADVFLLPSSHEGFGLAALEAMACATPVVATAVGGLPEVLRHQQTGLLVPLDDAEALRRAVLQLLLNPAQALAMGQAGREDAVRRFGREAGLQRWMAVYARLPLLR